MSQPRHQGEYPSNWAEIAAEVKGAASWCCVRCFHPHDVKSGHVLTVHHFDGNKSNCRRWNLMALCQRCHLSVQARVDPETPLLFQPAAWAMPYIAGFYESGAGVPGPLYDLAKWIAEYEKPDPSHARTSEGRLWPHWAPKPGDGVVVPLPLARPDNPAVVTTLELRPPFTTTVMPVAAQPGRAKQPAAEPVVNHTVPLQDRAKKQYAMDVIREMLLAGKRFNYQDVQRITGSPATAQRINDLCDQGYVIKRDKSAVGNGVVDYWMEPEDIEVARKVLAEHAKKKAARRQENAA
jgi:hypothetical protein